MALGQLVHRLLGISSVCLAVTLVPLRPVERVVLLMAFSLGVSVAALSPGYDRVAARLVGPGVLVLAVVPVTGPWRLVALAAIALIGFTSFDPAGLSRAAPALGLPVMTFMFRTGHDVSRSILLAWVVALILTVTWGSRPGPAHRNPHLRDPLRDSLRDSLRDGRRRKPSGRWHPGWWRLLHSSAIILILVPLSIVLADHLERSWPDGFGPPPRAGDRTAAAQETHPGLDGALDAGSPVVLSDDVVLRVEADRALYWRGVTYADWDGRRWTRDVDPRPVSWTGDRVELDAYRDADDDASLVTGAALPPPLRVTQRFKAEQAGLDVLLGAWRMDSLRTSERQGTVGDDGSVSLDGALGAGATWTVESEIVPATEADLRRADPSLLPADHPILVRYGREDDIVPSVADLARTLTERSPTTYDKIRALESWLDDNLTYTRDIDRLAPGSDAVHELLFRSRRGFCEQIGSALVVMLRSLGVPARLVIGYVPGEYDTTTGEWLSRGTDAHAWAEVYFPGVGWHGFDPTAGVPLASDEPPADPTASKRSLALTAGLAVAVLGGLGAARRFRPKWWFRRSGTSETRLAVLRDRLDGCGRKLDRGWHGAMTLREKGDDLVATGIDDVTVREAVRRFEQLLFFTIDHGRAPEDDLRDLDAVVARLEADVERRRSMPLVN